jgi:hypothetical protein
MRTVAILGLALLLTGCATGFNRQAVAQCLDGPPRVVEGEGIREALDRKPQLRFPITIAVHLVAESYRPVYYGRTLVGDAKLQPADWRWTMQDREQIDKWVDPLRKGGVITDLYVMSEMISTKDDLESARLAAAKHGADAVMLVKGVSQVDKYVDPSSILNLLVLPGYVIPSSHRDALFMMRAAMWDVGNECLYLSVDAEGEAKTRAPTFRVKEGEALEQAKSEALDGFGKELQKRLLALKIQCSK